MGRRRGAPEDNHVLHELLAEVVVDAVELIFREQRAQFVGQLLTGLQVHPKRLFHDQPQPGPLRA